MGGMGKRKEGERGGCEEGRMGGIDSWKEGRRGINSKRRRYTEIDRSTNDENDAMPMG